MKKKWIAAMGTGALVIGVAVAGAGFADSDGGEIINGTIRVGQRTEAQFPSMAKISMDEAVQKALASVQGRVLKTELEDENGFLVYDVEVVSGDNAVMEVMVDAGSGEVLAMERDQADEAYRGSGEMDDRDHGE